jgi:hypothetical protein
MRDRDTVVVPLLLDDCAAVGQLVLEFLFVLCNFAQKCRLFLTAPGALCGRVAHLSQRMLEPLLYPYHNPCPRDVQELAAYQISGAEADAHKPREHILYPCKLVVEESSYGRARRAQKHTAAVLLIAFKNKQGHHPHDRYTQRTVKKMNLVYRSGYKCKGNSIARKNN